MDKKKIFDLAICCFLVFGLAGFFMSVGCRNNIYGMKIIAQLDISTTPRHEWYPSITHNSSDNEFIVLWRTSGKLKESDTESFHSIDGQRVSPEGNLLGAAIQLSLPETGFKTLPRAAHNRYNNEYMVAYTFGPAGNDGQQTYVLRIDSKGQKLSDANPLYEAFYNNSHPTIVFNTEKRNYLTAYNDSWAGSSADLDNFGFIVDEEGNKINQEPFQIGSRERIQFNPQLIYNSRDDRYLVNWEDFRHQNTWTDPTDIFGTLLDADGNSVTEEDIPICDDHDDPVGVQGDQRVQVTAYNSDENEYLAVWMDRIITKFNEPGSSPLYETEHADIVGRIIGADGKPTGEDFIIVDAIGSQSLPQIVYISEKKMYFIVWQDARGDESDDPFDVENDIYAKWLNANGKPVGFDIPICTEEGNQSNPALAYDSVMDRFLIVWRENNAMDDFEPIGWCFAHICEDIGDIKGVIYGTP
jgi:hypothetical protein